MYAIIYLPEAEIVKPLGFLSRRVKYIFNTIEEAEDLIKRNDRIIYSTSASESYKKAYLHSSPVKENVLCRLVPIHLLEVIEVESV